MEIWLPQWRARGWLTASKKPPTNLALIMHLDCLLRARQESSGQSVLLSKVKGHDGLHGNERADVSASVVLSLSPLLTLIEQALARQGGLRDERHGETFHSKRPEPVHVPPLLYPNYLDN